MTVSPGTVRHVAACPEVDPVGCAQEPIPDHRHEVGVTMVRASLLGTFGIGRDLSVELELPFDAKLLTAEYTTLDGAPFEPPYGDLHHRDETLSGIGDPVVALRWDRAVGRLQLGGRAGVSLPLGDTTENPEPLAAQSLPHQHMQIGSGTFAPVVGVLGAWVAGRWGLFGRIDAVVPLYENDEGFRRGLYLDAALGPGYRLRPGLFGFAQLAVAHTGEETWDGNPNESSALDALRLVVGGTVALGERFRLGPVVQIELASRAMGGSFDQPFIGTLTITYGQPIQRGRGAL